MKCLVLKVSTCISIKTIRKQSQSPDIIRFRLNDGMEPEANKTSVHGVIGAVPSLARKSKFFKFAIA